MAKRGWFYRVRVALLLGVLVVVLLFAYRDYQGRRARNDWSSPLRVGLVVLKLGEVDAAALAALSDRARALEQRLASEFRRYRPERREPMFEIVTFGPVNVTEAPPAAPGASLWQRARHAYALSRYTRAVDAEAGIPARGLDSRVYVVATPAKQDRAAFVEGFSEAGGRVGVASVELDPSMVDFALIVAAHELFHTLGATDKYDESGHSRIPEGLADPDQEPRFPQRAAELMARNRVLTEGREVAPESLDEIRVGPLTAREIGWIP